MSRSIGHTVSTLRKKMGMSVSTLTNGILSEADYYRFANGTINISVTKFLNLLERLTINFDEFLFLHNHWQSVDHSPSFNAVSSATSLRGAQTTTDFSASIAAKQLKRSMIQSQLHEELPTESIIRESTMYLLKRESWTHDDLILFSETVYFFPCETRLALLSRAFKGFKKYAGFRQNRTDYFKFLCQLLLIAFHRSDFERAQRFIQELLALKACPDHFFEQSLQTFFESVSRYLDTPIPELKDQISVTVGAFKTLHLFHGETQLLINLVLTRLGIV